VYKRQEYLYAFVGKAENEALVILRIDSPEKAVELLEKAGVKVLDSKTVYKL